VIRSGCGYFVFFKGDNMSTSGRDIMDYKQMINIAKENGLEIIANESGFTIIREENKCTIARAIDVTGCVQFIYGYIAGKRED
jgi:hypothetical protein